MSTQNTPDPASMNPEALQNAVQSILQNPAVGRLLSEMQGKDPAEAGSVPAVTPEMMEKLPQMMAVLAPLLRGGDTGSSPGSGAPAPDTPGEGTKPPKESGAGESEKRKRLLAALRPYLSENRREAVDGILKVTEMTDLLGGLGLHGPKT